MTAATAFECASRQEEGCVQFPRALCDVDIGNSGPPDSKLMLEWTWEIEPNTSNKACLRSTQMSENSY